MTNSMFRRFSLQVPTRKKSEPPAFSVSSRGQSANSEEEAAFSRKYTVQPYYRKKSGKSNSPILLTTTEKTGDSSGYLPRSPVRRDVVKTNASNSPESSGGGGSERRLKKVQSAGLFTISMAGGAGPKVPGTGQSGAVWYDQDEEGDEVGESAESIQSSSGVELEEGGVEDDRNKLHNKISQVKERLKQENVAREIDVDEYIRLTQELPITPDNPQLLRIKQVFEKKNKKHSQAAEQLQKKLEAYNQRLRELERGNRSDSVKKGDKNVLTNVHQGLNSVIAVPKDLATRLMKHKFGSADNLHTVSASTDDSLLIPGPKGLRPDPPRSVSGFHGGNSKFYTELNDEERNRTRAMSEQGSVENAERNFREGANSAPLHHNGGPAGFHPPYSAAYSSTASAPHFSLEPILVELRVLQERQERFSESLEQLKQQIQLEYAGFHGALHEEKYRYQRLEDQLNDTIELHQAEVHNLKLEIQSIGARTDYQHDERYRDLHEAIENAQNRVLRLEQSSGQQIGGVGPEGMNAVALRSMNVLVLLLQVILIIVSTIAQFLQPFIRTRSRALLALLTLMMIVIAWRSKATLEGILWRPLAAKIGINNSASVTIDSSSGSSQQ